MYRDDLVDLIAGHDLEENWPCTLIDLEEIRRIDLQVFEALQEALRYRDEENWS